MPVEDQGNYEAEIVNNCTGGGMERFLGSWLMMNDDGTLVSSAKDIPLVIIETGLTFPNWGVNKATIVKWSVEGKTLTMTFYYDADGVDGERHTQSFTLPDDDHLFFGTEYIDNLRLFVRAGS